MLRQSRLRYSAVPREVDRRTLLVGGGSSRECPGERLVTNIVAHVTMMDSPFDEFNGAALDAAAGCTNVTNVTPSLARGGSSFNEEGERVSPGFLLVDGPRIH